VAQPDLGVIVERRLIDALLPLLPELLCHREDALSVFVVHVTANALWSVRFLTQPGL
jgi:hypothetical protein